ncbi:hypothetical protein ACQP1P_14040 [Dactylosporangium sp. CA-052675]|uniref:hypothetical protein n=1 Tax=Dactylosporangium sp. CA-052675 TaxID=3239927 RepID=UPI003D937828
MSSVTPPRVALQSAAATMTTPAANSRGDQIEPSASGTRLCPAVAARMRQPGRPRMASRAASPRRSWAA